MKIISILTLLISLTYLGSCQTPRNITDVATTLPGLTGPMEIDKYEVEKSDSESSAIRGVVLDENDEGIPFMKIMIDSIQIGTNSDLDGRFKLEPIQAGHHIITFDQFGTICSVPLDIEKGDQIVLNVSIALYGQIELMKPIIYVYPEETTEVEIEVVYDGKITTTYPKYPTEGWKVTASPDGNLIDENNREYYGLYWEGVPREPLGIVDGFVVSKEHTIPFLEEKLALLGLNAKESNEFIIFWLPILEKNDFNLIHFSEEDYLKQAQLNISPHPDMVIRVTMVFQGLDEQISVPQQDLTSLERKRKGFTVVEWGGQEIPKSFKLDI